MSGSISGKKMWVLGEHLAKTGYQLPKTMKAAQQYSPRQLEDAFDRLQAAQRPEANWSVRLSEVPSATPEDAAMLQTLFKALQRAPAQLERMANPSPVTPETLALVRAGKLYGSAAKSVQRKAMFEAFRLFNGSFERGVQGQLHAELAELHGPADAAVTMRARKPKLGLAEEQGRRADTVEVLLRLHLSGQATLSAPLVRQLVSELGNYGGDAARGALEQARAKGLESGDGELAAKAERALARIDKAHSFKTTQILMEGGPIPAGGIRSYINALTQELPRLGHPQDLIIPLPKHIDPEKAGMKPVAGSEGSIRDVHGNGIGFSLYKIDEPPKEPGQAPRTFYFIRDDWYFTPRNGVYIDGRTNQPFGDESERLIAGAMLSMAALSKITAIQKLGGGDDLTTEAVKQAERSMTPSDAPELLQVNDAHFAVIEALRRKNPVFAETVPFGVMHNGGAAYQPWVPKAYVEPLMRGAGPELEDLLARSGDRVNLMEVMLATMPVKVVSEGYLDRLLNQPGAMDARLQVLLQEGFASGRVKGTPNGITLAKFDPASIEGTTQVAPYGREDFSGKTACKLALQEELGLQKDATAPLFVFGGRIATQKGLRDLLAPLPGEPNRRTPLDIILAEQPSLQIVMGGPLDEPDIGPKMEALAARWPDRVKVQFGFVDNRKLMSAGDVFLMPSREEPCGIAQEEAEAMGLAVLFTHTDGLRDTVSDYDPFLGTGEGFACELRDAGDPNLGIDPMSLLGALRRAAAWAAQPDDRKATLRTNALERAKTFDGAEWAKNVAAFMRHVVNLHDLESGLA